MIGFDNWLGSFLEVMELTELVWHSGQDGLDGHADGALPVGDYGVDRHRQRGRDLAQQVSKVTLARTLKTAGEQNIAREAITQDPQDVLTLVRLQAINGEDHVSLFFEALLEASLVSETQGDQRLGALQEVGNRAGSNGNLALLQVAMDFWHAAVGR